MEEQTQSYAPTAQTKEEALQMIQQGMQYFSQQIRELLKPWPELAGATMRLGNDMQRSVFFINGLLGVNHMQATQAPAIEMRTLADAGSILGEQVRRPGAIRTEDLQPSKGAQTEFQRQRAQLYDGFEGKSLEELYDLAGTTDGSALIRGVAKLAGLPDYREAELTADYLKSVAAAVRLKKEKDNAASFAQQHGIKPTGAADPGAGTTGGDEDEGDDPDEEEDAYMHGAPNYEQGLQQQTPPAADPGTGTAGGEQQQGAAAGKATTTKPAGTGKKTNNGGK